MSLRRRVVSVGAASSPSWGMSSLPMVPTAVSPFLLGQQTRSLWEKTGKAFPTSKPEEVKKTSAQDSKYFKFHDKVSDKAERLRTADGAQKPGDKRFYRPVEDYREIQDGDAFSSLFKEKTSVAKLRLRTWRKQFEKENDDVEMPYERISVLNRCVPNSFIRFFIRMRDNGGLSTSKPIHFWMGFILFLMIAYTKLTYYKPEDARSIRYVQ